MGGKSDTSLCRGPSQDLALQRRQAQAPGFGASPVGPGPPWRTLDGWLCCLGGCGSPQVQLLEVRVSLGAWRGWAWGSVLPCARLGQARAAQTKPQVRKASGQGLGCLTFLTSACIPGPRAQRGRTLFPSAHPRRLNSPSLPFPPGCPGDSLFPDAALAPGEEFGGEVHGVAAFLRPRVVGRSCAGSRRG